jgi:type I restriction enzyme M protein
MTESEHKDTLLSAFIWKNAEDLWGDFKHVDFGKIILPFTLLRRLECVLEPTRDQVRELHAKHKNSGLDVDLILRQATKLPFYNTSQYSLDNLGGTKTKQNLEAYIAGFSDNARVIFDQFDFINMIGRLAKANVLFKICQNFANTDLHPNKVPDRVMSNIYEHLIRRFGAEVNEAAEDFMTPRDVVHLATTLLLDPDDKLFEDNPGLIRTLYDPTCGTGGFLTDAMNFVEGFRDRSKVPPVLIPYGQELEPETHAVALAGMLLRTSESDPGRDLSKNIAGPCSTLSQDMHAGSKFHYCLSNPPFGKKWEKDQDAVVKEHNEKDFSGRFGPGLPRVSDGSMLFLLHLVDKLEHPDKGGGRAAIILSGSPLFTGNAGQGESEIRRWLLEKDLVEAIVALPTDIFFRTGIGTYIWLLSNKKAKERRGLVQLIDATGIHSPMRKSEGNKRKFISEDQILEIAKLYEAFEEGERVKIIPYQDFGYRRILVQRPLRLKFVIDQEGLDCLKQEKAWERLDDNSKLAWEKLLTSILGQTQKHDLFQKMLKKEATAKGIGKVTTPMAKAMVSAFGVRDEDVEPVMEDGAPLADRELEDFENVPLSMSIDDYMATEVLPHVADAWVDETYTDDRDNGVGRVGYEINFNRYFYKYVPPRDLLEIDAELVAVEAEIATLLDEVAK